MNRLHHPGKSRQSTPGNSTRPLVGQSRETQSERAAVPIRPEVFYRLEAGSASEILNLRQMLGNRAFTQLIQASLEVSKPGDRCELEAERIADHVMGSAADSEAVPSEEPPAAVRRYEDEDIQSEEQTEESSALAVSPSVQPEASDAVDAGAEVENRLSAARGGGMALPEDVRAFMEPRFGHDFGKVRLHTDGEAALLSRELNAQAFAHGADIYMGEGRYNPGTSEGKRLLAHELTHIVQQGYAGRIQGAAISDSVQCNGVTFPTYADIVANATVTAAASTAWQETKDATTEATRREQSFWIRWNSSSGAYSTTGHTVGPAVNNKPPAGASVTPSPKPADSGNDYTVGMFHTHTPTTHWTAGYSRDVGPSGPDVAFHNGQGVPGVVYDYTGVGGKIRSGHPLNSAAQLWQCGPNRRT